MHVVFRESHDLEETATPQDLGQGPADLVVLSYSDSDLGAFAAGWQRGRANLPGLRLANLAALRHPISVDTYVDQTLSGAKGILVRLIGGESYWSYGLAELNALARKRGIALAVLPGDGRDDDRLDELSTLPVSTLRRLSALCDAGGAVAAQAALAQLALAAGLYAAPVPGDKRLPDCGFYEPARGVQMSPPDGKAIVPVIFYRAYLAAADTAPIDALIHELRARGFQAVGMFAPSLKAAGARIWVEVALEQMAPVAIVNATAFSARGDDGRSPLDGPGCPVFQVALSTAERALWLASERGLSPSDLAMHVVLPEVDGRIFAGAVSFKCGTQHDPDLQFSRKIHQPDETRVRAVADRVARWHSLATAKAEAQKPALILSTYPGKEYQLAHAVGLDALASCEAILLDLAREGYAVEPVTDLGRTLSKSYLTWSLSAYRNALDQLPEGLRADLQRAWGDPDNDPAVVDGGFHFAAIRSGEAVIALQPERGLRESRDDDYHDLARVPRHAYVAFYLWLRAQGFSALIHIGAHGTLEWLPGKSVALSDTCWPQALLGDLPVLYPFIVNDPGEAAQAKRRLGAVTLGHMPPPMRDSAVPEGLSQLERLLDEYSTADGLDPARRDRLIAMIRAEAQAKGVEADLGINENISAAEAIVRIDRFVCDIKDSGFGDGLHIYGAREGEREGLHSALAGRRVPPGPSGSPYRGHTDVLPTGRNLFSVDPRAVPTRVAFAQGVKNAEELVRRHLQDHGDWPRGLVIDLWGSATMRTAGEEFAMALHLAGLTPRWDGASGRVTGFEIVPPALLNRPRIDVTLRVSGLFRDVFPGLAQMFEAAAAALADRDEPVEENPYVNRVPRVFGPKPGLYGLDLGTAVQDYSDEGRRTAGEAWIRASEWSIDVSGESHLARKALESRLRSADAFAHAQDLPETDVLLAADYAGHEGGFAAAMSALGRSSVALYHLDTTRPETPRARTLSEEIARVVRARAANPEWAAGMMRHGFRGAAELAATLDHLAAFAHLARNVPAHLFDLYHDATLGRGEVADFIARENPDAFRAMQDQFRALRDAGLWQTRSNSIAASLEVEP
ncbi:cobaltochelatase CobN subunit [Filomicrobium insigne]|uniref:Cobaltochelatase CobN subunit n=1 Tax=Filomicrobium insigne TaxID=418854 RepID=A0A1H0QMV0_9HYPH|nr:cobaltochelatase subunit CobN [Filomicrobium insigne]SDP18592.1 cobaltochelatase CobN subunit [Filomicrobium insigne]